MGWPQRTSLTPNENLVFQAEDPFVNPGFPARGRPQAYLCRAAPGQPECSLMLQQVQQSEGSLFQQLETVTKARSRPPPGPVHHVPEKSPAVQPLGTQHGFYMRDDPIFSSPSELSHVLQYGVARARTSAASWPQNAKAYLLQTSINSDSQPVREGPGGGARGGTRQGDTSARAPPPRPDEIALH